MREMKGKIETIVRAGLFGLLATVVSAGTISTAYQQKIQNQPNYIPNIKYEQACKGERLAYGLFGLGLLTGGLVLARKGD